MIMKIGLLGILLLAGGQGPAPSNHESLEAISKEILAGVRRGDPRILLRYEPQAVASKRKVELKQPRHPLYCYVFDSSCLTAERMSVRDAMLKWKQPAFWIHYWGKDKAVVFFYDRAELSQADLRDTDRTCAAAYKHLFSWKFERLNRRWVTQFLPFDESSDSLCPPEED